jgi:hypothetical protein
MTEKIALPLIALPNLLPTLRGVHVHAAAPIMPPSSPGPYSALIDTGSSHTWVKPHVGKLLEPHSLEDYVIDRGDGVEEDAGVIVKSGFMKGLQGTPLRGWVQLEERLPALDLLLLSGEFEAPTDLVIGMDLIFSFLQFGILIRGMNTQPTLVIEY